jgi:PAS domain S-box-containing protein
VKHGKENPAGITRFHQQPVSQTISMPGDAQPRLHGADTTAEMSKQPGQTESGFGPAMHNSELHQARIDMEATLARYADLYDFAPVGYFTLDRYGAICEANLTGANLLGMTRPDLIGKQLGVFISPGSRAPFSAFLKKVFEGRAKETRDVAFLNADHQPLFAHIEATADKSGRTCRLVMLDINERRKAELALMESEERFRVMADSAPVLIWITMSDDRFMWFNKVWLDFTGRKLEQELGDGWTEGVHPEDLQECIDIHASAFEARQPFSTEYRLRSHDGSYRHVLANGVPRFSPQGEFVGFIGSCTDISDRKKIEEALQHSKQMLRHLVSYQERVREDERKRIAREIHDDLGQNLLALRLDVSMLHTRTERTHPKLNKRVSAALDQIDATMRAVRSTINNLRPTVLDLGLNAAIEWQVNDFQRRSGIACELSMDENDLDLDDTRATALFRILQESLTNVIRHAQASRVQIDVHKQGNSIYMRVADDGIGIYPDCRRKANSFGLVGIEERVSALGGSLVIDTDRDSGTALIISIPLQPAHASR